MPETPTVETLATIAIMAGRSILQVAARGSVDVAVKFDDSPVTAADQAAEALICEELDFLFPHIPIVAEERVAEQRAADINGELFFLVDPLDGTKEFVEGRRDYTVNIAVIRHETPLLGVVYAPARGEIYWGSPAGAFAGLVSDADEIQGARQIGVRPRPMRPIVVASRSHGSPETERFARSLGDCDFVAVGSSLKFCLVAEGGADVYPRFGRTMEWDTAAGHAVLLAAGGCVYETDGKALRYGKLNQAADCDFANRPFIAAGSR